MKVTEAQQYLGKQGKLSVEGGKLSFDVVGCDIRSAYGRTDVLVIPLQGNGKAWVQIGRIQWEED